VRGRQMGCGTLVKSRRLYRLRTSVCRQQAGVAIGILGCVAGVHFLKVVWHVRFCSAAGTATPRFEPALTDVALLYSTPNLDMAPLPSTTQTLTTRLNTLSESNKALGQLIQRLAKLDFQPGSQPLGTEEGDVRLELSAEIHESLKGLEEDLELLRQEVEDVVGGTNSSARRRDSRNEAERSRLAVLLARLTEDLKS
jgi:hypothetical protein